MGHMLCFRARQTSSVNRSRSETDSVAGERSANASDRKGARAPCRGNGGVIFPKMGLTDFVRKQTPTFTPMVVVGTAMVVANVAGFAILALHEMQAKSKLPGGVDWFDLGLIMAGMLNAAATTLISFMSRHYGRYAEEKETAQRRRSEIEETRRDFGEK